MRWEAYLSTCTDATSAEPRKFLIDVDETLHSLLEREDTDRNMQITIEDGGPKVCAETRGGLKINC